MTPSALASFSEWVATRDGARTGDPLWAVQAYRLASYANACHTFDRQTNRPFSKAVSINQLTKAIGSVSANIAEGYSRPSRPDQNKFYGYALGSAREAIEWYDNLRFDLGIVTDDRQAILIQVRRLLLTMLRNARSSEDRAAMAKAPPPRSPNEP